MTADPTLQSFFEIASGTVFDEDRWLRHNVTSKAAYKGWNPGVACLYETGLVQLILKDLWRREFPVALGWEVPYSTWALPAMN